MDALKDETDDLIQLDGTEANVNIKLVVDKQIWKYSEDKIEIVIKEH